MSLSLVSADHAIAQWDRFDTVIDARSESEYALDHLPGACNWPTLNDGERHAIGTMYKQVNAFEAKKRGAAIAARNIAAHIEREVLDKPRDWAPLAYCWRGGKRSGSLSLVLDQIGFRVSLIEGGYKAFRAAMLIDLERLAQSLQFQVVCGTTGSGKTRLLHALAQEGAQVLDLEHLARHRSSVLGAIPGESQPSQKRFDTLVWDQMRRFDPARPVFVESESKKVGNVAIHSTLVEAMRRSTCLMLELDLPERVALLLEDYSYFVENPDHFCSRLDALTAQKGKVCIEAWKASVLQGDVASVVRALLVEHYDPVYLQSIERNFSEFGAAQHLRPNDRSAYAMTALARQLL
ncbi:MAG: tRNA 2-selenouridine(34) synthase MnmH [Betaproteobacteria bacterium]|jgi:tRNA 2-selenouridine synthase